MTDTMTTDDGRTTVPTQPVLHSETVPPATASNPRRWWRRRGFALAAIIVGAVLALGMAFGGGVALGWGLGAASGASISGDFPGRDGQNGFPGGPGGRDGQLPPDQNGTGQNGTGQNGTGS